MANSKDNSKEEAGRTYARIKPRYASEEARETHARVIEGLLRQGGHETLGPGHREYCVSVLMGTRPMFDKDTIFHADDGCLDMVAWGNCACGKKEGSLLIVKQRSYNGEVELEVSLKRADSGADVLSPEAALLPKPGSVSLVNEVWPR